MILQLHIYIKKNGSPGKTKPGQLYLHKYIFIILDGIYYILVCIALLIIGIIKRFIIYSPLFFLIFEIIFF